MFKKLRITCNKATTICDKSQYQEASIIENIKLNLHFLTCQICRLYSKQNSKMTRLFKSNSIDCKRKTICLSETDKRALKKQLEEYKV